MRLKKKLEFIGLFCLSSITIVVAIVRAVYTTSSSKSRGLDDITFLWLWSLIQASLGMSSGVEEKGYSSLVTQLTLPYRSPILTLHLPSLYSYCRRVPFRLSPTLHRVHHTEEPHLEADGHILTVVEVAEEGRE